MKWVCWRNRTPEEGAQCVNDGVGRFKAGQSAQRPRAVSGDLPTCRIRQQEETSTNVLRIYLAMTTINHCEQSMIAHVNRFIVMWADQGTSRRGAAKKRGMRPLDSGLYIYSTLPVSIEEKVKTISQTTLGREYNCDYYTSLLLHGYDLSKTLELSRHKNR